MGPSGQPLELYEVRLIVPLVELPQFTLMLLVPCPEVMAPPVTTQVKVVPLVGGTLYVPDEFEQSGFGPEIELGPTYGRTCIV